MKISVIQMDTLFARPEENFARAVALLREAAAENADVAVLPELWNTGFFPREDLESLSDRDCQRIRDKIGPLAAELGMHIVAGSVSNLRKDGFYNTACVFDRRGELLDEYDKVHLFTPMGEDRYYKWGERLALFTLDGVRCGVIICYDLRFPELARTLALQGMDILFVVAQWPRERIAHADILIRARAIENQMFVAFANSCATAGKTRFGGHSAIIDPLGDLLVQAGDEQGECILTANCDLGVLEEIRRSINVFRDREPSLYALE